MDFQIINPPKNIKKYHAPSVSEINPDTVPKAPLLIHII